VGNSETYGFTHAVVRHALYDNLTPSRRSRLHRRVAEALERAGPSQASAAEIAVQYHRTVSLPGAERGVEPALEAAGRAQDTGAYDEAATFLRMALDLLPEDDSRRPRLLGRLGIVLAWGRAFDEAADVASQAGDAIAESETKQAAAEYLSDAAYVCAMAGGVTQAWELARQGLTYAGDRDIAWARLLSFDCERRAAEDPQYPGLPTDTAERRESARILREARLDPLGPGPIEAVFDSRKEAAASTNLFVLSLWAGEHERSLPLFEAEAAEAEALGRLARAARAWAGASLCQSALGHLDDAQRSFEQATGLAARLGTPVGAVLVPQHLLCLTLDEGWAELAATYRGLIASENPALAWVLGSLYGGATQAAAYLGREEEALAYLRTLVPWLERAPVWMAGFTIMACGPAEALWLLERQDHLEAIEQALRQKLLPADLHWAGTDSRLALARLCALTGRHDEAVSWFADARRAMGERAVRPLLAICDFDEALMYARRAGPGDAERAVPLLDAARAQFEAIGMTGWIRRADELREKLR
jgi:tetratricopeptide (TPR) repeat protein